MTCSIDSDEFYEYIKNNYFISDGILNKSIFKDKNISNLKDIIFSETNWSPIKLYKIYSKYIKCNFINLKKYGLIDSKLIKVQYKDKYIEHNFIPLKLDNISKKIIVVISDYNDNIIKLLNDIYGLDNYIINISTPYDIEYMLSVFLRKENLSYATNLVNKKIPEYSVLNIKLYNILLFLIIFFILLYSIIFYKIYLVMLLTVIIFSSIYLLLLIYKLTLFLTGVLNQNKKINITNIKDSDLPRYTILAPMYKESNILMQFVQAMQNLDYPKNKLEILIILEQSDVKTMNSFKKLKCNRYFKLIIVPYSSIRTKPKACNYALQFATGEYITIFDAEDIPDPQQLKKAFVALQEKEVLCVQAKMRFYNWDKNILTKLFSIEYGLLFEYTLNGLAKLGLPIPLGGTGNHFRTKDLKDLYAWDALNVTEDADLGFRISSSKNKIKVLDSYTYEGCVYDIKSWYYQRLRWLKGYMQTYLVHKKHIHNIVANKGFLGFLTFYFILGIPFLHLTVIPVSIFLIILNYNNVLFSEIMYFSNFIIVANILVHILFSIVVVKKQSLKNMQFAILGYSFFYFISLIIVAISAFYNLIVRPYYWNKTDHSNLIK